MVNHKRKSKTGKSKKAEQLVKDINEAILRLVSVGESIAIDFPEIREPMVNACRETKTTGKLLQKTSEFLFKESFEFFFKTTTPMA